MSSKRAFSFIAQKPILNKQLNELAPDAIVTTGDGGTCINRYCNIWAQKNKVPFIVIQPSFIADPREKQRTCKERFGHLFFNTATIFSSGASSLKTFIKALR